jgi:PhnB protein
MGRKVRSIPKGHHSITPYLIVSDAKAALDYYHDAFGSEELMRLLTMEGKIAHAEIQIGNSVVMVADEFPQMNIFSPTTYGGTSVTLVLYVENADAIFHQALAAGGKIYRHLENQVYGDRSGMVIDPFGHLWSIATHIEDVTPDEMKKRLSDFS